MIFERKKTLLASNRFLQDIHGLPDSVKNNTIILIGPMGTGKSTIAKLLANQIEGVDRIPLDSKEQLKGLYARRSNFRNFKNFEFVLTGTVLSSLRKPYVIDFGAGHSIYEDEKLREQMKKMCSQFKNIILLLPSKNKDMSRKILLERRNITLGSHKDQDNWHFITAPNNYELATDIVYEEGKTPEDVLQEIIQLVKSKERDNIRALCFPVRPGPGRASRRLSHDRPGAEPACGGVALPYQPVQGIGRLDQTGGKYAGAGRPVF